MENSIQFRESNRSTSQRITKLLGSSNSSIHARAMATALFFANRWRHRVFPVVLSLNNVDDSEGWQYGLSCRADPGPKAPGHAPS